MKINKRSYVIGVITGIVLIVGLPTSAFTIKAINETKEKNIEINTLEEVEEGESEKISLPLNNSIQTLETVNISTPTTTPERTPIVTPTTAPIESEPLVSPIFSTPEVTPSPTPKATPVSEIEVAEPTPTPIAELEQIIEPQNTPNPDPMSEDDWTPPIMTINNDE